MKYAKLVILMVLMSTLTMSIAIAETGTTNVTIINSAPTISSVELNDASTGDETIVLTAATTTVVNCSGIATDPDGNSDITGVSGVIWSANAAYGDADSPANHYTDADCGYNSGDGSYACSFDVQFYADAASWTCNVTATDNAAATGSLTDTNVVQGLLAFDIPDATNIDFGSLSVGQSVEGGALNVTFKNQGNIQIDVRADAWEDSGDSNSANAFNCTVGNIGISNFVASLTDEVNYAAYTTSLTQAGYVTYQANLNQQTTGSTPTNDTIFFGLQIPTGLSGQCTGIFSLEGVAS